MRAVPSSAHEGSPIESDLAGARGRLIYGLREHALRIGDVALVSGDTSTYYVDAKRALLRSDVFCALIELMRDGVSRHGATAVGGLSTGAHTMACAALAGGAPGKAFFLREDEPAELADAIEGAALSSADRCLIVKDMVTTGGRIVRAVEIVQASGLAVCGVVAVVDRLVGGAARIAAATRAPYEAFVTIDDLYPERLRSGAAPRRRAISTRKIPPSPTPP